MFIIKYSSQFMLLFQLYCFMNDVLKYENMTTFIDSESNENYGIEVNKFFCRFQFTPLLNFKSVVFLYVSFWY